MSPTTTARWRARDGARVADHRVHRRGERVRLAVDRHLDGVADEQDVHAGRVEQRRRRRVVGGHHRDALATLGGDDLGDGEGILIRQKFGHVRSLSFGSTSRRSGSPPIGRGGDYTEFRGLGAPGRGSSIWTPLRTFWIWATRSSKSAGRLTKSISVGVDDEQRRLARSGRNKSYASMSWARYSGVTAFSRVRVFFLIRFRHVSIEPCR